MKHQVLLKWSATGLLMLCIASSASAQKIAEKDLKANVTKINNSSAQLNSIQAVTFDYNQKNNPLNLPAGQQYGFTFSEAGQQSPLRKETAKMVESGKNQTKVVRYDEVNLEKLIPVMVAEIQQQQAEIEQLKSQISSLKHQSK
jgi:S-adenosylmethionine synthetase